MQRRIELSNRYFTIFAAVAATAAGPALAAAAPAAAPAKPAQSKAAPTRAALIKGIDASFKSSDANGDGVLSLPEVSAAEAKGLQQRVGVARQRMEAEFGKLDTNKDGQLSKAEFMAAAPTGPTSTPNGASALAQLDKNKDGKLSLDEYRAPLLSRFDAIDTNHDGTISGAEKAAAQAKSKSK
jgi:Ca2+-binding EF-hand superfamily protein